MDASGIQIWCDKLGVRECMPTKSCNIAVILKLMGLRDKYKRNKRREQELVTQLSTSRQAFLNEYPGFPDFRTSTTIRTNLPTIRTNLPDVANPYNELIPETINTMSEISKSEISKTLKCLKDRMDELDKEIKILKETKIR